MTVFLASIVFALKRAFWFVKDHWRIVLCVIVPLLLLILFYKACESKPKLDHEQIIRNQEAIRSGERKRMEEALVESKTAEAAIDANRADAEVQKLKAVQEARQEANRMTNQELADFLEGRK